MRPRDRTAWKYEEYDQRIITSGIIWERSHLCCVQTTEAVHPVQLKTCCWTITTHFFCHILAHNLINTRLRFSPNDHKRLPGVYPSPLIQPLPCYNRVWRLSWCCLGLLWVPQSTGHTLPQSFPLWTPCSPPPSWLSVPWHSAKMIILSVILANKFTKVTQNTSKSSCSLWFRHLGLNTTVKVKRA